LPPRQAQLPSLARPAHAPGPVTMPDREHRARCSRDSQDVRSNAGCERP
jgi:hypothetical protein